MENVATKTELSESCFNVNLPKSDDSSLGLELLTAQASATLEVTHHAQTAGFFFEFA